MELQEFMQIVIEKLDKHEERLDNHEETLNELKRATLNIEDYVTNKIPALFDAYSVSKEKSDELEEKVQKLEKTTSLHSIKISILEESNKNIN